MNRDSTKQLCSLARFENLKNCRWALLDSIKFVMNHEALKLGNVRPVMVGSLMPTACYNECQNETDGQRLFALLNISLSSSSSLLSRSRIKVYKGKKVRKKIDLLPKINEVTFVLSNNANSSAKEKNPNPTDPEPQDQEIDEFYVV